MNMQLGGGLTLAWTRGVGLGWPAGGNGGLMIPRDAPADARWSRLRSAYFTALAREADTLAAFGTEWVGHAR
jgi:hypothetical protein